MPPPLGVTGFGHAGLDSSVVLPITPGNGVPGGYSTSAMMVPSIVVGSQIARFTRSV